MLLVIGLAGVLWSERRTQPEVPEGVAVETSHEEGADLNSLAAMSQTDVFDDLVELDADEALNLQMILDDMAQEGVSQQ